MAQLYIERQIRFGDEIITETELLQRSRLIIVLAEPGAGKTDLLTQLAKLLGTERVRATRFRSAHYAPTRGPLVIDAMDEVARLAESELNDIIEKARANHESVVVFASRSGEWEQARTKFVEECFGIEPNVVYLHAFNADEQKRLFEDRFPGVDFAQFAREARRNDLSPLLGNPELLQLFGYAYLENGQRFGGKTQIYEDASMRLAAESNEERSIRNRPDASVIVNQAGAVFARLLLSGASGVSLRERVDDRDFPYAAIVAGEVGGNISQLLDSKLFKPSDDANEHEPVHRIVAEFLAARYLAGRIRDAGDRLSLKRILSLIAPNGVVRDELRGLLGWLAALGDDATQKAAIAVDPYAVLANGDPSGLLPGNRPLLISGLQSLEKTDPYFRRSDEWRSFNVGQFFTDDTVDALRSILAGRADTHLRGLILELIQETPVVGKLKPELKSLTIDRSASDDDRREAAALLLQVHGFQPAGLIEPLLSEGSAASLRILTYIIKVQGIAALGFDRAVLLLQGLAELSPKDSRARHRDGMSRYFVKEFLREFPADDIDKYLDLLTADIRCTCSASSEYSCECRFPISNIAGGLLDRYFEAVPGPYDSARIWSWTKNLRFKRGLGSENSISVRALTEDDVLRRSIHELAFSGCSTCAECNDAQRQFFFGHSHSGLKFRAGDTEAIVEHAFDHDRIALWEALYRGHRIDDKTHQSDQLRARMRAQALLKPGFMEAWARCNRAAMLWWRENRRYWGNSSRRYAEREAQEKNDLFEHLRNNRGPIEAGQRGWWTLRFAEHYLHKPDRFDEIVDDKETAYRALRSCLSTLEPHVPTLDQLARREKTHIAVMLHAACILRWRETGSLNGIPVSILRAVKTESGTCNGISENEASVFEAELDKILFPDQAAIEQFAREYLEPALSSPNDAVTNVEWLNYKKLFQSLLPSLPLEWLRRFPDMPHYAETVLFKMAVRHGARDDVRALIAERVERHLPEPPSSSDQKIYHRRYFWLLNSFFHDDDERVWDVLRADQNTLLQVAARSDRFSDDDERDTPLSAVKLYRLMDAFVEAWPPVELPSGWGTGDPPGETAYRFMREIPWRIGRDEAEQALLVLDQLLTDPRFSSYRNELLTVRATAARKAAHSGYRPPSPSKTAELLELRAVASVEDMRALMVDVLTEIEGQIRHAETDTIETFYTDGKHVDENTARNRIVEALKGYMTAQRLSVVIEHHMAGQNRCDLTASEMIEGRRRLLTVEVKGQWHDKLFTAAAAQLDVRYASNPDAERQGVYLVLWFGPDVEVVGVKNHGYRTPGQLREAIIDAMPPELRSRINVQMIDLSRPDAALPLRPRRTAVRDKKGAPA